MFKKTKVALMSLLCAGCLASAGVGVVSYEIKASAATPGFKVENGAQVRLKEESADFGIRFSAFVGEAVEGATYNMLILPAELVERYNNDTTGNKANIVAYMEKLAADNNGKLSIVKNCPVCEDGKIYGSIVNVKWNNINRDFVAVAYYEKDGEIVEIAAMADDGARSVVDVSNNAIESGDYNGSDDVSVNNKSILVDKIRKGEKQAAGYASEDTYIYEDFRFANEVATYSNVNVVTNNSTTEVVEQALQVTRKSDYNYTAVDFGTVGAGDYQFTFQLKESEGYDYNNWKIMQWNKDTQKYDLEKCSVWDLVALGDNTYSYYFTTTEDTAANFAFVGLVGSAFSGTGQITLDNLMLKEVESIPTVKRDITTLLNENFEGTTVSPYQMGSVQNVAEFDVITFVDNGDNGNALRLEKTKGEKCTLDFVLPLGKVTKGQYKLTLQMKTNYNQVLSLQNVTLQNDYQLTSLNSATQVQADFNYGNFYGIGSGNTDYFQSQARPLGDDVWEYHINFKQDMESAGLRLYNYFATLPEGGAYLQLDNIKFEKSCEVVVDFENGRVVDYSSSGAVGTGKAYANVPYIRTTNATAATGNTRSLYNFDTKKFTGTTPDSGDRSYTNKEHGTYGYALRLRDQVKISFNMGYVEAGTYQVTWKFGLWGSASNPLFYNGAWAYWGTSEANGTTVKSSAGAFSLTGSAGNEVTYQVTVSEGMDNYYCVFFPSSAWGADTVIVLDSFSFVKVA